MPSGRLIPAVIAAVLFPAPALAGAPGFFVGLDASVGTVSGSSNTTDGGAPFAGGGVVRNVDFGTATGFGGHVGYRFNAAVSAFVSYRRLSSDVRWDADFPLAGVASSFRGKAVAHAVTANIGYDLAISDAVTAQGSGLVLADVARRTRTKPMAQLSLGIEHRISPGVAAGLTASASYGGGFETGDTRVGNLGVTDINPYRIGHIWRTGLAASVRFRF